MIALHCTQFLSSKDELAQAIDRALRRFAPKSDPLVNVRSRVFPYLDEIVINFDGAQFDSLPPAPPVVVGETKLACEAAIVTLSARNVSVRGAPLDLRMEARDVVFHQGRDGNSEVVLIAHKVRDGQIVISAAPRDLENAIVEIGGREARPHGIAIEQVRLTMRACGPRSIAAEIGIRARKFLLRAKIDISVQLDIDDDFVAKISKLKCKSHGAIGSLACNALDPYLRQLEGHTLSLKSLPLGEIQVRDIRIAVLDTIELTIDFGTAQS
ncbi:MAG: hypothetical protein WA183_16725 [Chthoniobacterales bacterium]